MEMKATKGMYMNINFPLNYCENKRQKFHDDCFLFQPIFLNLHKHIFEHFRLTGLIKNWILYEIDDWCAQITFTFMQKIIITFTLWQLQVFGSLTKCPHSQPENKWSK